MTASGYRKRILHFGKNVANNPYNNVKALESINQDKYTFSVLSFDNPHGMAQPEWEEVSAKIDAKAFHNDWQQTQRSLRPEWFESRESYRYSPKNGKERVFPVRHFIEKIKDRLLIKLVSLGITRSWSHLRFPKSFGAWVAVLLLIAPGTFFYLFCKFLVRIEAWIARQFYLSDKILERLRCLENEQGISREVLDRYIPALCRIRFWLNDYDLVQVYSTDAVYTYLCLDPKYIVYDNGPLREFAAGEKPVDSLLRLSYLAADHVFLTNPDVGEVATDIGLSRVSHVPHYIDTDRYCDGPKQFRSSLVDPNTFLVFAPARQNWNVKGNQIMIEGYAKFAQKYPDSLLLIADWGQHADNSRALVSSLGIDNIVQFYPPIVKSRFVDYLRSADVVIDQCIIPTIGGIGPEAMATETPLITSYAHVANKWCFPTMPPLHPAFSEEEVSNALCQIASADANSRKILGKHSREWVLENCSLDVLIRGHLDCYDSIL
ncbi:MAG: glycosyltransferase family 4 protein [Acidiferrobacterales bacterium]|nr:glycosyltransferase family 4 protein [Acidiferrobacterales bacterium]